MITRIIVGALVLALASCKNVLNDPRMPRLLGMFKLPHAAFVEVFDTEFGERDMYMTTFNPALPYFHDPVFFLRNPGDKLDSISSWPDQFLTLGSKASAFWPNYPVQIPKEVFGFDGIVQTSGFLVPGKKTGKLEVYDVSSGVPKGPVDIAVHNDHEWSYHWVIWRDMDGDGFIDALTARFRVPGVLEGGDPISQLLWFKNPGTTPPSSGQWPWESSVLTTGPDVYFEETQLELCVPDCALYSVILSGELWTEKIMLYYVENPEDWIKSENIKSMVVDSAPGQPFEAHFADINNDGRLEILASCYDTVNETGSFWAYESQGGEWKRTALASGFIANSYLFGNSMTPGKSRLFWPSEEYKKRITEAGNGTKPWIALSGDDDGVHYILFPKSEDPLNMEYDMQVMVDTEATTAGTMAVTDLDKDGYTEIISAGYTAGEVYVYTFKP